MHYHRLKAKYENHVLRPEHPLDLPEGSEVTLLVITPFRSFKGILEEVKDDSVSLQHRVKDLWEPDAN
jgi:predicted DNA-binding antitoxin AbrB/MazE fold protein